MLKPIWGMTTIRLMPFFTGFKHTLGKSSFTSNITFYTANVFAQICISFKSKQIINFKIKKKTCLIANYF